MQDGSLDNALKPQRRLWINVVILGQHRYVVLKKSAQLQAQVPAVTTAGVYSFHRRWVVKQRGQQVLDGDVLVALIAGALNGAVERGLEFS